jgi:hypothetical protein
MPQSGLTSPRIKGLLRPEFLYFRQKANPQEENFMAQKDLKLPPQLVSYHFFPVIPAKTEFKDTDPQMLFAIWDMENGVDPDISLERVQNAKVVYDKFRPRLARR